MYFRLDVVLLSSVGRCALRDPPIAGAVQQTRRMLKLSAGAQVGGGRMRRARRLALSARAVIPRRVGLPSEATAR
jgi:hypothetical protein